MLNQIDKSIDIYLTCVSNQQRQAKTKELLNHFTNPEPKTYKNHQANQPLMNNLSKRKNSNPETYTLNPKTQNLNPKP